MIEKVGGTHAVVALGLGLVVIGGLWLAGARPAGAPGADETGVNGSVSLGPTCPVMRDPPDPQCADRPYATAIAVYRSGAKAPLIIGSSRTDGTFSFALPKGSYTLVAGNGEMLPRCAPVEITVASGYASADVSCDTGIR